MEERRNLYCGGGIDFKAVMSGVTLRTACTHVNKVLEERGVETPYTRFWEEDGLLWMDYGSWSSFFVWGHENDLKVYIERMEDGHE